MVKKKKDTAERPCVVVVGGGEGMGVIEPKEGDYLARGKGADSPRSRESQSGYRRGVELRSRLGNIRPENLWEAEQAVMEIKNIKRIWGLIILIVREETNYSGMTPITKRKKRRKTSEKKNPRPTMQGGNWRTGNWGQAQDDRRRPTRKITVATEDRSKARGEGDRPPMRLKNQRRRINRQTGGRERSNTGRRRSSEGATGRSQRAVVEKRDEGHEKEKQNKHQHRNDLKRLFQKSNDERRF